MVSAEVGSEAGERVVLDEFWKARNLFLG